jgi:hypothetical protein
VEQLPALTGEIASFMPASSNRRDIASFDTVEDQNFRNDVASISISLKEIALLATFVRKWTPWLVAVIGLVYPTIGKVISQLPPMPH